MGDSAHYIHGTDPSEQQRLAALNGLTNGPFVEFLDVQPGTMALEVGSGLGLLAAEVASSAQGVRVVGVELSAAQIAAAARHPALRYVRANAEALPFGDGQFDLVYARYLLEHVSDRSATLEELRRVTRRHGRVAACENDVTLVRLNPDCPAFDAVWSAFQQHQQNLGGDSHVGRRLYQLFRRAGFRTLELSVQPEVHWHGSPGFAGWIQNLMGNVASAQRGMAASGLCSQAQIDSALAELGLFAGNDEASFCFVWNRIIAVR